MSIIYKDICEKTCEVARAAGKFILDERKNFSVDRVERKGANDFVSYVDKNAEKIIVEGLMPLIENAGFLTEEGTVSQSDNKEYTWIVDPLDGTTNYIHGLSPYAVSIGLTENKIPVLGVIYMPAGDECFYAWKDSKAYLNNREITTSDVKSVADSLVIIGFSYKVDKKINRYLQLIKYFTLNSHGIRRLGSAAADLAYVACGRADIFFQTDLKPWDVAAGVFIAQRAGAAVTDFDGGNDYLFGKSLIAANNEDLNRKTIKILNYNPYSNKIWIITGLFWGVLMFLYETLFNSQNSHKVLISIFIYAIAGLATGYCMKRICERQIKKLKL